jgi:hypothetical protein
VIFTVPGGPHAPDQVELPEEIRAFVRESTGNYGKVKLVLHRNKFWVESGHPDILRALLKARPDGHPSAPALLLLTAELIDKDVPMPLLSIATMRACMHACMLAHALHACPKRGMRWTGMQLQRGACKGSRATVKGVLR